MCGIFCSIAPKGTPACPKILDLIKLLYHRGPDEQGAAHLHLDWASITLAAARLKITDQNEIPSPYTDPRSEVTVAYVGEIYNWRALRDELFDGYSWTTQCDVEIIPRAWRKWGPTMLDHFNGMWSMVLVDQLQQCVFAARDRAGKKPLFYSYNDRIFYVSSEIKAFPFAIEETPCLDMETLEFDFGHSTPVKGVYRVEAGEHILMTGHKDLQPHLKRTKWWTIPQPSNARHDSAWLYKTYVEELADLITDAVRIRLSNEVKTAVQLSGGLDSAIIQSVARSSNLYCVDFSDLGVDNISRARIAAKDLNSKVELITFNLNDILQELPQIVYHLDAPATWSALALWFMNRKISKDGCRVILSGEGADELFNGYSRYRILYWMEQALADPHLGNYQPLIEHMQNDSVTALARMLDRSQNHVQLEHAKMLVMQYQGQAKDLPTKMARVDFHTTMQVLLRMGDRMAMAHSIENRCPFLDHRIISFSQKLPASWKITPESSKTILRDTARILGVPDQIVDEKNKVGLVVPWNKWQPASGSRGQWTRTGFANLMKSTWRAHVLRPAICQKSCL